MSPKFGGCNLERVCSQSAHSDLYRAFSEELQQPVMIKLLAARFPANSRTGMRFLRGGQLAVELEHVNIVRIFAAGQDHGRPYMLMEYLTGHSLDRILEVKSCVPWEVAAGIVRQAAKALDAANEKGIVHRAIEPSHIMLSPGGRATVLGFGLARMSEPQDAGITADGALVNVGAYSPPETGEGIPDVRADIYSLGCVFYHLLTGKPPFIGRDPLDYLHQHRTAPVWPVADLVPEIPSAISQVVAMMLEKSLSARLQKPTDLIALLDAAISPEVLGAKGLRPDTTMVSSTMEMLALRDKMTALVCDDQEYTLSLLQAMLRRLGVKVLVARTGRAAVSALEERREINMVVTDLKVPQLWGCHLLDAITNVRPELPILLTRGGEEAERIVNSNCYRVMQYFDRPLDVFALRSAVSSLET
jgi:serine/threonine protein kinase